MFQSCPMVWRDVVNPEDRLAPAEIILSAYIPGGLQTTIASQRSRTLLLRG
jgi:hypothetical protein